MLVLSVVLSMVLAVVLAVVLKVARYVRPARSPPSRSGLSGSISKTATKEQVPGQAGITDMGKIKPASGTESLGDGS